LREKEGRATQYGVLLPPPGRETRLENMSPMSDTSMSIHLEDEVSFLCWSPISDTSMSMHPEDEVSFLCWSPISDTSMNMHPEDEVSFLC
jgi:hypothetical protein